MKRKLSTSSVAAFAPEFIVPRVPVRHRSYVVPRYRARPHSAEKKLLGMASVSDLRVVPPPTEEEEPSISVPPAVPVHVCKDKCIVS